MTLPATDPPRPTASDITIVSPIKATTTPKATKAVGGAAGLNQRDELRDLERKLTRRLTPPSDGLDRDPGFGFRRIAFDSLGASAPDTTQLLDEFTVSLV